MSSCPEKNNGNNCELPFQQMLFNLKRWRSQSNKLNCSNQISVCWENWNSNANGWSWHFCSTLTFQFCMKCMKVRIIVIVIYRLTNQISHTNLSLLEKKQKVLILIHHSILKEPAFKNSEALLHNLKPPAKFNRHREDIYTSAFLTENFPRKTTFNPSVHDPDWIQF